VTFETKWRPKEQVRHSLMASNNRRCISPLIFNYSLLMPLLNCSGRPKPSRNMNHRSHPPGCGSSLRPESLLHSGRRSVVAGILALIADSAMLNEVSQFEFLRTSERSAIEPDGAAPVPFKGKTGLVFSCLDS
jgi:hypothetical protein